MINKQSLWFVTLFSMILVLSIYYVTMKDDTLATIKSLDDIKETEEVNVTSSSALVALRVADDEEVLKEMEQKRAAVAAEISAELQKRKEAMAAKVGHNMQRFVKAYPNLNRGYKLHNLKNIRNKKEK